MDGESRHLGGRGAFLQGWRLTGRIPSGVSGHLRRCVEPGGNFHHHQPEEGHGDQQRAWVGHVTSPQERRTLKRILRNAGLLGERPKNCTSRNKTTPRPLRKGAGCRSIARVGHAHPLAGEAIASCPSAMATENGVVVSRAEGSRRRGRLADGLWGGWGAPHGRRWGGRRKHRRGGRSHGSSKTEEIAS